MSEARSGVNDPDSNVEELLEHLQNIEARARSRVEDTKVAADNERLRATLARNNARTERNATVRFVALCLLVAAALGGILYTQLDSRGSGQLRQELVAQCEIRNGNTLALQTQLLAAAVDEDDSAVADDLEAAARTLRTADCRQLH